MPHDPYKSMYIHIPFCVMRCNYCDFNTKARDLNSPEIDEYIEKIISQIRKFSKEDELGCLETIYIGGGTPSYVGSKRLSSLLYAISLSVNLENVTEMSIEANPESVDESLVKDIWALGVNRISMGVQSFDDDILKMLGRAHNADTARRAIYMIKKRFNNFSIDLMCGIPGQSLECFNSSLKEAILLDVPHVSIYPLSIENNTVFNKWAAQGRIDPVNEDEQAEHMELAHKLLTEAGYVHYEVASYAKPGYECKHNLAYWTAKPYLGVGLSATTMTQNSERRMRVTDFNVEDDLNPKQMVAEDLMLCMRTKYGCSPDLLDKARSLIPNIDSEFDKLENLGLVKNDGNSWIPTHKGWMCGNDLYYKLLELGE